MKTDRYCKETNEDIEKYIYHGKWNRDEEKCTVGAAYENSWEKQIFKYTLWYANITFTAGALI